ncbi:MAG: hypothetical protein WCJ58_05840 [bacterium]
MTTDTLNSLLINNFGPSDANLSDVNLITAIGGFGDSNRKTDLIFLGRLIQNLPDDSYVPDNIKDMRNDLLNKALPQELTLLQILSSWEQTITKEKLDAIRREI